MFLDSGASYFIQLSENRYKDPDTGWLYCNNAIVAEPKRLKYYKHELKWNKTFADANEEVYITTPKEEFQKDEFHQAMLGKSLTIYHPQNAVDGKNWKDLEVGVVLKSWFNEDLEVPQANIVIKDEEAIELIESGLNKLSLGYKGDLEKVGENEYIRRNIKPNHLAMLNEGRSSKAMFLDNKEVKGGNKMNLLNLFKGKKIRVISEDEFVLGEDFVDEKPTEKDKEEKPKENEVTETTTTQEEVKDKKEDEKEEEKEVQAKDEKGDELKMSKEELQALLQENQKETLESVKQMFADEMAKEESVFKGVRANDTNPQRQTSEFKLDFQTDEELRREFYSKFTDPTQHGSHEEFEKFQKNALRVL